MNEMWMVELACSASCFSSLYIFEVYYQRYNRGFLTVYFVSISSALLHEQHLGIEVQCEDHRM